MKMGRYLGEKFSLMTFVDILLGFQHSLFVLVQPKREDMNLLGRICTHLKFSIFNSISLLDYRTNLYHRN